MIGELEACGLVEPGMSLLVGGEWLLVTGIGVASEPSVRIVCGDREFVADRRTLRRSLRPGRVTAIQALAVDVGIRRPVVDGGDGAAGPPPSPEDGSAAGGVDGAGSAARVVDAAIGLGASTSAGVDGVDAPGDLRRGA